MTIIAFTLFAFPAYAIETSGEGPLDTVGASCSEEQIFTDGTYNCSGTFQAEGGKTVCQYDLESDCTRNLISTLCRYEEERSDVGYSCIGSLRENDEGETVCQFSDTIDPKCEKGTPAEKPNSEPSDNSVVGNKGEALTSTNYKAPQNTNYSFINMEHTLFCELTGSSPVDKCIGLNKDKKIALYDRVPGGGAAGGLTNVMVAMYSNPPTSTAQYLADLGQNLGFAKPALAQSVGGSGEGIIKPVKALWQVTRNLAYLAFIIVFIMVGFMIMFRARINPQTIISAQSALPGLVIGLILVTFSYFVAALIVDLSFVSIQVVGQIFLQVRDVNNNVMNVLRVGDLTSSSNAFHLFVSTARVPENIGDVTGGVFRTFSSIFGGGTLGGAAAVAIPAVIGGIIGTILFPGVGTIIGIGVGAAAPLIIGLIVPLILIIVLIIQFFRLLFQLVSAYISVLVATVTGPFIILFSSIPGRGTVIGLWWKTLLGNSLVFPAVFAAFLFAGMILWTPLENWTASPPLFGGLSTELLRLIIAYGLILGTPAIPGMVKKALGVPELQGIPQEAMAGTMAGFGAVQAGATPLGRGALTSAYSRFRTMPGGTWQHNLAQRIWNRYGAASRTGNAQRYPWFASQRPP